MMVKNDGLDIDKLTWAVLLAKWVEFAKGVTLLGEKGVEGLLKASVVDVIMLQAVWFSLGEVEGLEAQERDLGVMRSGVLIEKHIRAIRNRWGDEIKPELLEELMDDVVGRYDEVIGRLRG